MRFIIGMLAIFGSCFLTAGCGGGGSGDGGGGTIPLSTNACGILGLNSRVINGTVCENPGRSAVVRFVTVYQNGELQACSGAMLSQRKLLTAAHCLLDIDNLRNAPEGIVVVAGERGNAKVLEVPVEGLFVHTGFRVERLAGEVNMFNDIAVAILPEPAGVPTLPIITSASPTVGEAVQIYGYGQSEVGTDTANSLEELIEDIRLLRSGEMEVQLVTNNHIRAVFSNGSGVCRGDSGGPLVYVVNGRPGIVGVASQLVNVDKRDCSKGAITQWTRLQSTEVLEQLLAFAPEADLL